MQSEIIETMSPALCNMQTESIGKLALALSKAQGELMGASKGTVNKFFESKYADLHQCIEAAREPLSKNELAVIQTTRDTDKGITIVTTLVHSSGEWIRGELTMIPTKNNDQGRGSSITYGRRYAYAAIVGLAQKDDDGNAASKPAGKPGSNSAAPRNPKEPLDKVLDGIEFFAKKDLDSYLNWYQEKVAPEISSFIKAHQDRIKNSHKEMQELLMSKVAK